MKRLFIEKQGGVASYLTILAIVATCCLTLLFFTIKAFIDGNWALGIGLALVMIVGPVLIRIIMAVVDSIIDKTFKNKKMKKK